MSLLMDIVKAVGPFMHYPKDPEERAKVAAAVKSVIQPHTAVNDCQALILYFATEADRQEFVEAFYHVKPNAKAYKV